MALNLFGPPTKDDIKVAYIDPALGLVEGVSICEANEYAKREPGTTFIFRNGNQTLQYLNVNEVNQLDPNVLTTTDECGGISQKKECGPPTIQIFGGGGIGAAGNPIVGNDGAILAVDIIRGGNGYQYPPLVSARDICNYGSGATFTTVIGEVVETTETFDNEADFEDYELCDPTDVGYGRNYGPDGEDLGPWDPKVYTEPGEDPIKKEVEEFERIVRRLARAPFWTTRKNKPTKITCSDTRVIPSKYDVTFSSWNEFMNTYAISPVSPSNVRGSDFAGRVFTFEWTEDFPTDGEYIFRGLCDNTAQLYVDDLKIADLAGFNAPVRPIQKTFQKGLHNIRVDLLNVPITQTVTKPSVTPPPEPSSSICISVIDEASPSSKSQQADWDLFRKNYPGRKFYLLDPGGRGGFKKRIPSGFDNSNNAFGPILVNRDGGNVSRISDWFTICGLNLVPTGTAVSLAIDTSGSMRETTVRASYAAFKERCRAAGIVLVDTTFRGERFVSPHNKPLPAGPTQAPAVGALPPTTETIISPKSWNENPMGVSVTIDAPQPPIPQEPKPEQEGRCPNNPIWTTRFPGAKEFWYPVTYRGEKIERIIEVSSSASPPAASETQEVSFSVYGQGSAKGISGYSFTFTAVDGQHTFTLNGAQKSKETRVEKIQIRKNVNYDVVAKHRDGRKLEQGLIKQGTKKREGGIAEGNIIFADGVKTANDNDDIQIILPSGGGIFKSLNKTKVGGRSTFDITYVLEGSSTSKSAGIVNTRTKEIITTEGWSKFFNRYAISPVPPLDTPGSDGGGVVFTNSWDLEIPYDGFYKFAVQRDETARIFVDGNLAFDIKTVGDDIWRDFRNKPKFQKIFIAKGRHTISVELENTKTEAFDQVSQKIFRTKDWQVAVDTPAPSVELSSSICISVIDEASPGVKSQQADWDLFRKNYPGRKFYLLDPGGRGGFKKRIPSGFDNSNNAFGPILVNRDGGNVSRISDWFTICGLNLVPTGTAVSLAIDTSGSMRETTVRASYAAFKERCRAAGIVLVDTTFKSEKFISPHNKPLPDGPPPAVAKTTVTGGLTGGTSKDGVTYDGPPLFAYKDNRWGTFMNNHSVSPIIPGPPPDAGGRKKFTWRGVKFPESGQYDITFLSDTAGILFIGGREVLRAQGFAENPQTFKVNITQGTYDIVVDNDYPHATPETNTAQYFRDINPTGFGLVISKNVSVLRAGSGKSWKENPMGIGAILIPPPCPRRIRGKGIVTDIIVNDPGNGYLPPILPTTTPPSTLALIQTNVPGVPGGGAGAGAGGGTGVPGGGTGVPGGGTGVPGGPGVPLTIPSPPSGPPTGINARFIPQFEVVRDPVVVDPQKLLQVTDLVGLKQTGYVNGRAYYGAVYYDKGIRYAGFYETVGEPVRVYDTLRESILAQVTTPPSAILRQGTDIRSNDPLLNIPGTVQSTLSSNSIVGAGDIFPPSVPFVQEPLQDPIYPVSLRLKRVLVEDPGINYNVTDQIRVIPSNGAVLEPVFGSFGRVIKVAVIDPGFGFTEYPRIEMFTPL